jgi:hypothetical protein
MRRQKRTIDFTIESGIAVKSKWAGARTVYPAAVSSALGSVSAIDPR